MFDSRSYRKPLEREISRQLRHEGWSYKKIAAELDVSVSSVYAWTNHIALTEEQIAFNLGKGIPADSETVNRRARTWVAKNRARREEFQEAGRLQARKSNAVHEAGCMLYWAEGAKDKNVVTFCNSDMNMLRVFIGFLRECFEIPDDDFTVRLNVYLGNGMRIEQIEDRWLEALDLPRESLRKPQINHFPTSSSGKKVNKLPLGVCTLRVKRSTWLVQHIYGAIQEYGDFEEPAWLG